MKIDTDNVVSMTDVNQNFSEISRIVDKYGQAVILKNNAPCYIVMKISIENKIGNKIEKASTEKALASAEKMMNIYDETFRELAK